MPVKPDVDAVDRRILRMLADDGRASYQSVADEVGLSRPAVMERVKRLEERGFIKGYGARLDRAKAGFPVTAFVAVRYGSPEYVGDEPRIRHMEQHPGVLECHHVAGDDCYILKVAAPDLEGVQAILREVVGTQQAINTRTTIVLSTLFEKPSITLPELD
jgi:Lrp/AsnC family leucine-responsive transcriptional regulator